jgi:secondary thiamine-phosphate synthase enzyme
MVSRTMLTLAVKTGRRTQAIDVTAQVRRAVREAGVQSGMCCLYVPHTTAAIFINENADPDVAQDIEATLDRLVPHGAHYRHTEGNADSHVKSVLVGASQCLLIEDGQLVLGHWQGIFFCEFDGPRERRLLVKILRDPI